MSRYFVSLIILIALWGCDHEVNLIHEVVRNKGDEEIVGDVILHYTDSGRLQVLLKAPLIKGTVDRNSAIREFTQGINCEFYDDSSKLKAKLTARYAIRNDDLRIMTARDHVVLIQADSSKLETEELIWDENRQIIYSHKFCKYTRGKEVGTGFFFQADQSFTRIELRNTEADNIVVPGLKKQ